MWRVPLGLRDVTVSYGELGVRVPLATGGSGRFGPRSIVDSARQCRCRPDEAAGGIEIVDG